jgi:hypothetical protein
MYDNTYGRGNMGRDERRDQRREDWWDDRRFDGRSSQDAYESDFSNRRRSGVVGTPDYNERRGEQRSWERRGDYDFGRTDGRRYGNDDEDRRFPRNETDRLIASDKVEGTPVYDRNRDKIGKIENFMVGKRSGRVEYAVLSFGGFMGMGDDHVPIDWDQLTYDERCDGYVIDMSQRELERRYNR